ncbi:protein mono-ADP-ribosyltransferase PARP11-like [Arctopsyche grandis]|uniref:protein mono-ADP-ribosyltransferase PARP11-like n=1 Tax=Arctopsyche grandis TaxID=121162 RepID=UPI00406DA13F
MGNLCSEECYEEEYENQEIIEVEDQQVVSRIRQQQNELNDLENSIAIRQENKQKAYELNSIGSHNENDLVENKPCSEESNKSEVSNISICAKILANNQKFSGKSNLVFIACPPESPEFSFVKSRFMEGNQKHFKLKQIFQIINPHLRACYMLRKKQYETIYGTQNVKECLLFHGTYAENLKSIFKYNLDWRLHGSKKGNIFGQGVSFSPIPYYASHYCDKHKQKIMLAVIVLVCHICNGEKNMIIPPIYDQILQSRYDTSQKENGDVLVKYRDDEYYPSFLIEFTKKKKHL